MLFFPIVLNSSLKYMTESDIALVHNMSENKKKVKLNSNIHPNILSEIIRLLKNGGRGESLAQISN